MQAGQTARFLHEAGLAAFWADRADMGAQAGGGGRVFGAKTLGRG